MIKNKKLLPVSITVVIIIYLLLPVVFTLIYSFSTNWIKTVIPSGFSIRAYYNLLNTSEFWPAVSKSFILSIITTIVSLLVFVPLTFYIGVFDKKLQKYLNFISILPYVIPAIILVSGLVQLYGNSPIPKIVILILALVSTTMPIAYQSLINNYISKDFRSLLEQAKILGDSSVTAFFKIILPNISVSVLVSTLLIFTTAFGDYVLTNLLLGGNYETLKIYMYRLMSTNGSATSVLTVVYFVFLVLMSVLLIWIENKGRERDK
ncbi:MAG: ABC transporter permease subunit [Oenococcus oeni]